MLVQGAWVELTLGIHFPNNQQPTLRDEKKKKGQEVMTRIIPARFEPCLLQMNSHCLLISDEIHSGSTSQW